jgi:predicted transcriptional regulator
MQQQLAQLPTRGRLVVVKDNEGAIQFEAPGAIVQAVRDVRQAIP